MESSIVSKWILEVQSPLFTEIVLLQWKSLIPYNIIPSRNNSIPWSFGKLLWAYVLFTLFLIVIKLLSPLPMLHIMVVQSQIFNAYESKVSLCLYDDWNLHELIFMFTILKWLALKLIIYMHTYIEIQVMRLLCYHHLVLSCQIIV